MDDRLREARSEINESPEAPPTAQAVRASLDTVRPGLLADGGNVELLSVEDDGTVVIAMQGACERCPAAEMTLRGVIEPRLRAQLPGVRNVMRA